MLENFNPIQIKSFEKLMPDIFRKKSDLEFRTGAGVSISEF
jgi:hypothetical protein